MFAATHRRIVLFGVAAALIGAVAAYAIIFRQQTITYSYDNNACIRRLTLLPDMARSSGKEFVLEPRDTVEAFGVTIAARSVCVVAAAAPQENAQQAVALSPFGAPIFKATYRVETAEYPKVISDIRQPVPLSKPLEIKLSQPDRVFSYALVSKDRRTVCTPHESRLRCNVSELGLGQGEAHTIALERSFQKQRVDTPLEHEITTLAPLKVVSVSIENDAVVYEKPGMITFTADKQLESVKATLSKVGDDAKVLPINVKLLGDKAEIAIGTELDREAKFTLTLEASAKDGSLLAAPHTTTFMTSGGPKVVSLSSGSSGYIPGTPISIRFDQPLHPDIDPAQFVSLTGIAGTLHVQGSEIIITPQTVGRCASFSVAVKKGVVSQHDIVSATEWSATSRARCYSVSTFGTSVKGRPITAYYFGNGGRYILYTGAIHGNELSSKYIMESWINELDGRAGEIPADVTLVVVPVANPDGAAIGQRSNANGVNLNRNFPTNNWEKDIVTADGRKAGEGGDAAGSEPETKALIQLTQQLNPSLIVTFHSQGSLVNSNDAGNSIAKAQQYANLAGYSFISNAATTSTFGFTMTGTYEDWLLERGTAAFLIELNTNYGNHFVQNRTALWSTMR